MNIPYDLMIAHKRAYEPCGFALQNVVLDIESQHYGGCDFRMNNCAIKFRVAKKTPLKIGQFVTLYKRSQVGPIIPYDKTDPFDLVVISISENNHFGQFVFSKAVLYQKGFISDNQSGGKRAMRVYPPWDVPNSVQAKNTQVWQVQYFFEVLPVLNKEKMRQLLG